MKTICVCLITVLLFHNSAIALPHEPDLASASVQDHDASHSANIRRSVQKRGVGTQSRVRVKLRDGRERKGWISRIADDSFEVTDSKTGISTTIGYGEVSSVKGPGLSRAAQIAIGAAILVGVILLVVRAAYPST